MAQQIIQNTEGGLDVRGAINANFSELYNAIPIPQKNPNNVDNFEVPVLANTFLAYILVQWAFGDPVLRIGLTPAGEEILPELAIAFDTAEEPMPIAVTRCFMIPKTLYFTLNGGQVNISILWTKGIF